jgi:hypothetical protein
VEEGDVIKRFLKMDQDGRITLFSELPLFQVVLGCIKVLPTATPYFMSGLKPKNATKIEPISEAVLQLRLTNS